MGILSPLETVEVGCGMITIVVHISGFGNFSRCCISASMDMEVFRLLV